MFKLKKVNLDLVQGTFTEMKDRYGTYPYTCKSTSIDGVCQVLLKVNSWVSGTQAKVQYISYSSVDKDSTRTNEHSSNAKIQLETWYETNFVDRKDANDNMITDYIVDGTFCNDRNTTNSGYLLSTTTYYNTNTRLTSNNISANLKCNNDVRDKFSSTSSKGNSLLSYPIALITADEVALAGGKYGLKNENYYLRSGNFYWTMSPAYFSQSVPEGRMWYLRDDGRLDSWGTITGTLNLRPVINLSKDVLISSGNGSIEQPFQLKLN